MNTKRVLQGAGVVIILVGLAWLGWRVLNVPILGPTPTPSVTPGPTAVATPSDTETALPTWTLALTRTPAAGTVTETATETATATSSPAPLATQTAPATPMHTATATEAPTEMATATPEPDWSLVTVRVPAEDTYLSAYEPDKSFAFASTLVIGWGQTDAALLHFDLPLPSEAMVLWSRLEVWVAGWGGTSEMRLGIYAVLADNNVWEATWNAARSGALWQVGSCNGEEDRFPLPAGGMHFTGVRRWESAELVAATQLWQDGQLANRGILLRADEAQDIGFHISSAEDRDGHAPALVIEYAVPKEPVLAGLATHYDAEQHGGRETRSGETYQADGMTCAVPAEWWEKLQRQCVRIVAESGRAVTVRVNDSGLLTEVGRFSWQVHRVGEYDVAMYWPDAQGQRVVVDLPPAAFAKISPDMETVRVRVYKVPCPKEIQR